MAKGRVGGDLGVGVGARVLEELLVVLGAEQGEVIRTRLGVLVRFLVGCQQRPKPAEKQRFGS